MTLARLDLAVASAFTLFAGSLLVTAWCVYWLIRRML